MKQDQEDFFWPSYVDLMTALFVTVLALFVLSFYILNEKKRELENLVKVQKQQLNIIQTVESILAPLTKDSSLFVYEPEYKRFRLAFDINFKENQYKLEEKSLYGDHIETLVKVGKMGRKLLGIVKKLQLARNVDTTGLLKNISYLVIISGSASDLAGKAGDLFTRQQYEEYNYSLSYMRAYHLFKHWREVGIDFDNPMYHDVIELQIAGNGIGGVGRYPHDPGNLYKNEKKNQRFLIHIIPKIPSGITL